MRVRLAALVLLAAALLAALVSPQVPARALELSAAEKARFSAQFRQWLREEMRPLALRAGVPARVYDAALSRVKPVFGLPDLAPPGHPPVPPEQQQAEFASPKRYFNERSIAALAKRGRALARKHAGLVARIERRFGVPGAIVLAIWARESNYGRAAIRHDAFAILATQAFIGRRKAVFRRELIAALKMVASGAVPLARMKSSWAGALGQPQFMPSDYLAYAVDFDGDGRRDIWRSVPDVLASIANHLRKHGWRRGVHWGVEVRLPEDVPCYLEGPDQGRPLAEWRRMGVRRIDGRPFPQRWRGERVFLLTPAGRHGPVFLVSRNFYVIKDYNMSDLYALFIGHLSDRIAGRAQGPFRVRWGNVGHLRRADVARMQQRLEQMGHDVGGVDGLPGFRTRRSIGRYEASHGREPKCFPTEKLARLLR